jgi:hypothetical protein
MIGRQGNQKIRHLRERIMTTPKEYREYADECFGWAKTARSDRERDIFLQMAEIWLEAAIRAEISQIPRPDPAERSNSSRTVPKESRSDRRTGIPPKAP